MGTGSVFHKAGADIEKALDPVFVFILRTANLFEFVYRRNVHLFGRASKSAKYLKEGIPVYNYTYFGHHFSCAQGRHY